MMIFIVLIVFILLEQKLNLKHIKYMKIKIFVWLSTILSFKSIENKHDIDRGKDCIK